MEENIERAVAPQPTLPVDLAIRELEDKIALDTDRLKWLRKRREKLKALPKPTFCGSMVDFDNLPHADVVKVVRAVGGKWKKEPANENTIHYNSEKELDGFKVRCYSGAPPPSCKIVEIEEHVPEQIIPATTRKVRKLVCQPEIGAVIVSAAERHQASQAG